MHLMDRRNEGIWGTDPIRHGSIATNRTGIPDVYNNLMLKGLFKVTIFEDSGLVTDTYLRFLLQHKCEILRMDELER